MTVDVSSIVTLVTGAGGAVGAVGIAVTSVKFLTSSFRYYREVMGLSVQESMRRSREDQRAAILAQASASAPGMDARSLRSAAKDHEVRDLSSSSDQARLREVERDYEAMWAEQAKEGGDGR